MYRTVTQPLYGQAADIFGRFYPMLTALSFFILGSGICGGASSMAMLIAGRALQGIGAGGVGCLNEIIICDLVPLQQRGQWLGVLFALIALGTAASPVFGGLLISYANWRWTFYLSLPIGSFSLVTFILFIRLNHNRNGDFVSQLRRIDWVGNAIFIAAVVAILVPLSEASTKYPWSSWRILVPLLIGLLLGMPLFLLYEGSKWCVEPAVPLRLFRHRTTLIALAITFLHAIGTLWTFYFLPVYFQGVKEASPMRSGVMLLPTVVSMLPFVIVGGKLMEVTGRYMPVHLVGLAIMTVGFGLLSLLDRNSSTAAWVMFQFVEVAGIGMVIGVLLPAVQAPLAESDTALSASTWSFIRSFGVIWGVAIPSSIFNNRSDSLAKSRITDASVREMLSRGRAYEHATKAYLQSLSSDALRDQAITVFQDSMREIWLVAITFAGLAFFLAFFEKEVKLRDKVDTNYGLRDEKVEAPAIIEDRQNV